MEGVSLAKKLSHPNFVIVISEMCNMVLSKAAEDMLLLSHELNTGGPNVPVC